MGMRRQTTDKYVYGRTKDFPRYLYGQPVRVQEAHTRMGREKLPVRVWAAHIRVWDVPYTRMGQIRACMGRNITTDTL